MIRSLFNRARQAVETAFSNRQDAQVYVGGVAHRADPAGALGNPLIGLTPATVASYFAESLRGQWTRLQWLEYHAEHLDADLISLCRLRTSAVGEFNWAVQVDPETTDQVLADEQADALRRAYERIDNLGSVITHLEMSLFRGYAHVLKAPAGNGWTLHPLDQWWFVRDGLYGEWYWNPEARSVTAQHLGDEFRIDPRDYIVREEDFPVIWLACLKFVRANASQKWWDAFCESVAQQGTVIVAPNGLDTDSAAQFKADALAIARGASGVLPFGSQLLASNTQRGPIPFDKHMEKLSSDLIKATIGGILAIETRSGSGTLAGGAHQQTLDTIVNADARAISEIMQVQFDRGVLDRDFPGRPRLAYFELTTREEPDVDKVVANIGALAVAGYQVDPGQVTEQTGYKVTLKPQPAAPGFLANRAAPATPVEADRRLASRLAAELEIPAAWLKPIEEMLREIERRAGDQAVAPGELADWLEQAVAELPELFAEMDTAALAEVFERAMGTAALAGAEAALAGKEAADA